MTCHRSWQGAGRQFADRQGAGRQVAGETSAGQTRECADWFKPAGALHRCLIPRQWDCRTTQALPQDICMPWDTIASSTSWVLYDSGQLSSVRSPSKFTSG